MNFKGRGESGHDLPWIYQNFHDCCQLLPYAVYIGADDAAGLIALAISGKGAFAIVNA